MEDALDCLHVMFPNFDHLFLFDQSSGHTKKAFGGCDIFSMGVEYGGVQSIIKDSEVKQSDYGEHNQDNRQDWTKPFKHYFPKLEDCTDSDGPCYFDTTEEKCAHREDQVVGTKTIDKTRGELVVELREYLDPRRQYTIKVLQNRAKELGINHKKVVDKIREGWAGKPMGLYHELWMLGHIAKVNGKIPKPRSSRYTKNGRKDIDRDADGNLTKEGKKYCLTYLRSQCSDFANEKTAIEKIFMSISKKKGCSFDVLFTPKYHCELAGEGIEYVWGLIKRRFRAVLLSKRDKMDKFREAVRDTFKTVTVEMCRKYARQARSYMLVYAGHPGSSIPQREIERMRKQFRCHRDMSRLAIAFIEKVWRESIGIKVAKEEKEEVKFEYVEEEGTELCSEEDATYYMQDL